ncbi:MAG: hypothetical protein LBQ27_00545 [Clostridiales bacterium]|jgi:hypothetical protein|nr:hypothetical protein [Clostridiales bacterium]
MNKRKGILEELIAKNAHADDLKEVLKRMLNYYEIYDLEHCSNHYNIFFDLYFERKTYEATANDNFIHIDTLCRYIKRYNRLVEKLIKMIRFKNKKALDKG